MPPLRFKPPKQIRLKARRTRIVPLEGPDILLGKSIVAKAPQRVTEDQLENARRTLRKYLGKRKDFLVKVFATKAVTRKPEGVKKGAGKGDIHHFVANVPRGRVLFHVPGASPLHQLGPTPPNFKQLQLIAGKLPMPTRFRAQHNFFPVDCVAAATRRRREAEVNARRAVLRAAAVQRQGGVPNGLFGMLTRTNKNRQQC